jgi:hypothetical protein
MDTRDKYEGSEEDRRALRSYKPESFERVYVILETIDTLG